MNGTVIDKKLTIFRTLFMICGSVGVYLVGYLLAISLLTLTPAVREWHTMYLNALAMATAACATLFTVKKQEIGIKIENRPILQLAAVVVMAYSASVLFNILLGSIPWEKIFEQQVTPDAMVYYGIPLWARMLCYEVVAPVAEELLFRQVIYKGLRKISPIWLAVVISAVLFGLYHGNLVQGIYAFIMGCFLALVYEWTGSFMAPVVFHMVANHVSDITYEFESVSKVVYSPYGEAVSAILLLSAFVFLFKNKNKCSKKH
ncbi:MAG: CPBP family intramembrane metalloprotease [Lachnospiraceae bacterium]|nr:CPBP family intramembrane metalloprotease [Lachnospiraceae bacterium]